MTSWSILRFQATWTLSLMTKVHFHALCIIHEMLLCVHSSSMKQCLQFVNHEQQAQQVPANLRRGGFSIETPLENAGLKFIELASASKKTTAKQRENRLAQRRQRPFKKKIRRPWDGLKGSWKLY